jgi:hypothetical protein
VQVAGLAVVKRVGATRGRGVVARRLVCERSKGEAVGVEQRRCEPPWLGVGARRWVLVFDVFMAVGLSGEQVSMSLVGCRCLWAMGCRRDGGPSREHAPGGVCDIQNISERVAWRGGQRMGTLLDVREVCLEVL